MPGSRGAVERVPAGLELLECETLLDLALQSDWRAELRRRQGGRLEEALEDAVKWRKRTIIEESKGRAQLLVLIIQLARRDSARPSLPWRRP